MIEKTFTQADEVSAPIMLYKGQRLVISLTGTFVANVYIQRLVRNENDISYPSQDDEGWGTVNAYAAPIETGADTGDNCWYRALCSEHTSGDAVIKMKTA